MCREVLTIAGQTQESYRCERRKKGHRKHRARTTGADETGTFIGKMSWRRVPLEEVNPR